MQTVSPEMDIFSTDPFIGAPFDISEMNTVEKWKGFCLGDTVEFNIGHSKPGDIHNRWIQGEIIAIGENAKYTNGDLFVAIAVQVGQKVYLKTHREVCFPV